MRRAIAAALIVSSLALTGCATVLGGGSNQAVSLRSDPAAATFVIRSSSGLQIASGQTPQQVNLPRKNEYEVEFSMPGYQTQRMSLLKGLNGWVWANLVVGGVVGGAIDVVSGAAWKLEPAIVDMKLTKRTADGGAEMQIRLYDRKNTLLRELTVPMVPTE